MTDARRDGSGRGWLEASGLLHLFRILGLSVQPAKLGIALGAIVATFALGVVLDWFWTAKGGIGEDAVSRYVASRTVAEPYEEPAGAHGIFYVWREHERRCILGLLVSSIPGASVAAGTPVGTYVQAHSASQPLHNVAAAGYGMWWLLTVHPFYFLLFGGGCLLIWSLAGGAICRLSVVQFARDERLTLRHGLTYARQHWFDGFVLAPCIPLAFILILMLALALFGVLMRIGFLGDLLGGVFFFLPLIGGFVIALLVVGSLIGGPLFWPAVAAEGQDAYDAFSRGLSYAFTKPWKTVLYVVMATVYAGVCWLVVNLFTFFALTLSRGIVAWGTAPFGWWRREVGDLSVSKLELLWPLAGPNALYAWPDSSGLAWYENISAFFVAMYVLLVIGVMWAFLSSFFFCGCSVIYVLLRRDVDRTDLDDVYMDEEADDGVARTRARPDTEENATGVSLPVVDLPPAVPANEDTSATGDRPPDSDDKAISNPDTPV